MSGDDNYTIETTDSGASETVSVEAGQIGKGGYIMVKGKPCKVRDVSVSKTGKHGHVAAIDIFGNTCEELCPSTHSIDVPIVNKKDWQVQGIQDETYVLLMDDDGEMREDLQLPNQTYKTDDDHQTSAFLTEYCDVSISIFSACFVCCGTRKITNVRKKDAQ